MAQEINLKEIFGILKKRLWLIVLVTILATLAGYLYNVFFKPMPLYQSTTRIVIGADANNMSTLMVMVKDPTVMGNVSQQLNGVRSPNALANEIIVKNIDTSQVVAITVTDTDPKLAAVIANTTANAFKTEAAKILSFDKIQTLSEAKMNLVPINPANHNKMILGFFGGIILAIGLVFFKNSIDNSVQSERELEKLLQTPALGSIPKMTKKNMYRRRMSAFNKRDIVEFKNTGESGTVKKGKLAYKKANITQENLDQAYKENDHVQRVHH